MEKRVISISLLSSLIFSVQAYSVEVAKHLTTIVEPVPIKRIEPRYPIDAARNGKSGWARLSFVINEEGRVRDIVINEVVGHREFGKAAKNALRKWKYSPAMENGKPIQQCVNSIQMDFKTLDGGVSKNFRKLHKKAIEAIDSKDYGVLKDIIEKMSAYQHGKMGEITLYHSIAAHYAEVQKDKKLELFHLGRIDTGFWAKSEEKRKLSILNRQLVLAVQLNKFHQAFKIYNKLKLLDAAQPHMESFDKIMAQVEDFIGGEQNIIVQGDIEEKEFWFYSLVRNEFSLADIQGSLHKLDVRCANKRHTYTVENNNTWILPKAWKNCSLFVYGDDDTSFTLVEHPIKS